MGLDVVMVLSLNISSDLGGDGNTHGFSDSKKLTRTLVDATILKKRLSMKKRNRTSVYSRHGFRRDDYIM